MDTWDSAPTEKGTVKNGSDVKNKWEGEDDDDDVLDSWDQEPEEEPVQTTPTSIKTNTKLDDKEEKENECSDDSQGSTLDEMVTDKLRDQKLQEKTDLSKAVKDIFGALGGNGIESKEDFNQIKEEILKLVSDSVKNTNYANFTEEIIHNLCIHLPASDLKNIHTWVNNLQIERNKLEKSEKSKKSKGKGQGKVKLKMEGENDYSEYSAYTEDFDDFI